MYQQYIIISIKSSYIYNYYLYIILVIMYNIYVSIYSVISDIYNVSIILDLHKYQLMDYYILTSKYIVY